jgi:prepilin-type processing-associated H-X9-DG protein
LHRQILTGSLPSQPTPLPTLMCPSQSRHDDPVAPGTAGFPLSYVVNGGRANANHATKGMNHDYNENGVFVDKGVGPPQRTKAYPNHRIEEISKYDGTSNTIMLSETLNAQSWLVAPAEQHSQILWFPEDPLTFVGFIGLNKDKDVLPAAFDAEVRYGRPASDHPGGFNVAMCGGSIRFIQEIVDYRVYAVMMTSRGDHCCDPAATPPPYTPSWQSPADPNFPGVGP